MMREDVFCDVCGWRWDSLDPRVTYWYIDRSWACSDESECFERRAALSLEADWTAEQEKSGHGLG